MAELNNSITKSNMLVKIRSKYIVIKVFDNLKKNRLLKLIHYNKKYQKLMDKKIIDYKNEFSKIEIEIIPKENTYGKFIDISNKNIQSNFLIYFNDNKEEIKRKKISKEDNVTKIKIIINHKIKSLSELFFNCKCIKKINFIKFNKDDIKNMSCMFSCCSSLEEINLSNFNTNNVNDMSCMFGFCSSLKEINLSNFNTNNVNDMSWMFSECSSLKELNLSNFITTNLTYVSFMFYKCSSLKKINLSNFYTNNVNDMSYMFYECPLNISLVCDNDLIKKQYEKLLSN